MENLQLNFVVTSNMSPFIGQVTAATRAVEKFQAANVSNASAMASQAEAYAAFNKTLVNSGHFSSQMVTVRSEADKLGSALASQKLHWKDALNHVRQYRSEMGAITQLAEKQVRMQQGFVSGSIRSPSGKISARVVTPNELQNVSSLATRSAIATEKLKALHETVRLGSDSMINLGKNTQWAGRQMMVGLSLPIAIVVGMATKAFVDMDKEIVRIQKVYGAGLNQNVEDFKKQGAQIRKDAMDTAQVLASQWGQASATTLKLEGDLAAVGKTGKDLQDSVKQMSRLSILGEIDPNAAMKAGLALQTAFKQNNDELAKSIDFMNAVENQTSTSMNDLVEAIPRAGATIHNLGGNIQELSLYMTAMREGGVSAGEGANALKSGLASVMSPADGVQKKLKDLGIDIKGLVQQGGGDLTKTLMLVGKAMESLTPVEKTQAMVTLFGKFQYNKMAALLNNLGKEGSQTLKVLELIGKTPAELAKNSEVEMQAVTESASGKFKRMIESMKVNMAKLGQDFLGPITAIVGAVTGLVNAFNNMPDVVKKFIEWGAIIAALVGPIVMVAGVFMNFIGTVVKGGVMIGAIFKKGLRGGWKEWTADMSGAKAMAEGMIKPMESMRTATQTLSEAVEKLAADLRSVGEAGVVANSSIGRLIANTNVSNPHNRNFASTGTVAETKEANQNTAGRPIQSWTVSQLARGGASNLAAIKVSQDAMLRGELMGFKSKDEMFALLKQAREGNVRAQQALDDTVRAYVQTPAVQKQYNDELKKAAANTHEYAAQVMAQSATMGSKGVGGSERAYRSVTSAAHSLIREPGGSLGDAPTLAPTEREGVRLNMWANEGPMRVDAGHIVAREQLAEIQLAKLAGDSAALSEIMKKLGLASMEDLNAISDQAGSVLTVNEAMDRYAVVENELTKATQAYSIKLSGLSKKLGLQDKSWITSRGSWQSGARGALDTVLKDQIGISSERARKGILDQLKIQLIEKEKETGKIADAAMINAQLKEILKKSVVVNGELLDRKEYELAKEIEMAELADAALAARKEGLALEEQDNKAKADQLAADRKAAAAAKRKALLRGAGTAAGALGMAAMMIPQSEGTSAGATALDIAGKAGMGAMMGSMIGPEGAIAGAVIGAGVGVFGKLIESAEKASKAILEMSEAFNKATAGFSSDAISGLGGKAIDGTAKLEMPASGISKNTEVYQSTIKGDVEKYGKQQVEALKSLDASHALDAAQTMYLQLINNHVPAKKAEEFIKEIAYQAGHSDIAIKLKVVPEGKDAFKSYLQMGTQNFGQMANSAASTLGKDMGKAYGDAGKQLADRATEALKNGLASGGINKDNFGKIMNDTIGQAVKGVSLQRGNDIGWNDLKAGIGTTEFIKGGGGFSQTFGWSDQKTLRNLLGLPDDATMQQVKQKYLMASNKVRGEIEAQVSDKLKGSLQGLTSATDEVAKSFLAQLPKEVQQVAENMRTLGDGMTYVGAAQLAYASAYDAKFKGMIGNIVTGSMTGKQAMDEVHRAVAAGLDPSVGQAFITAMNNVKVQLGDLKTASGVKINVDGSSAMLAALQVKGFAIDWADLQAAKDEKDFTIRVTKQMIGIGMQTLTQGATALLGSPQSAAEDGQAAADAQSKANDQMQKDQQAANDAADKADQERADAMSKAFSEEEDAMQKQMDKAQRAREEELARVEKFYDDKIEAINKAEEARKKAFEAEQKRIEREKTWQNLQLDMAKALARGDAFGVVKAKMDMKSTQKGWAADDKNAQATDKAKAQTDKLSKEKATVSGNLKKKNEKLNEDDKAKLDSLKKFHAAQLEADKKAAQAASDARKKALDAMTSANAAALDAQKAATQQTVADEQKAYEDKAARIAIIMGDTTTTWDQKMAALVKVTGKSITEVTNGLKENLKSLGLGDEMVDQIMNGMSNIPMDTIAEAIAKALAGDATGAQKLMKEAQAKVDEMNRAATANKGHKADPTYREPAPGEPGHRSPGQKAVDWVTGLFKSDGGYINGPGGPTSDSIPAHLSNGEYVIRASAVSKYGKGFLDKINAKKFADGGAVGKLDKKDSIAGTAIHGAPTAAGKVEEALSDATQKLTEDRTTGDKKAIKTDKDLAAQKIKSTEAAFTTALDDANAMNARQTQMENVLYALKQTHIAALLKQTTDAEGVMNAAIIYRKQLQIVSFNELQQRNAALIADFNAQWTTWRDKTISDIKEAAKQLGESFAQVDYSGIVAMVDAFATGDASGAGAAAQAALLKAEGGYISGPGSGTSDSIPARLSNGEYVIKQSSVSRYGTSFLDKVNNGAIAPHETANFAEGGLVGQLASRVSTGLNEGAAAAVQKAIDAKNATLSAASLSNGTENLTPAQRQAMILQSQKDLGPTNAAINADSVWNGTVYQGSGEAHHVGWAGEPFWGVNDLGNAGQEVFAYAGGNVVHAGPYDNGSYSPGSTVELQHLNGGMTRYAHLQALNVAVGEAVKAGQLLGIAGSDHLHFEWKYMPSLVQHEAGGPPPWMAAEGGLVGLKQGGFISPALAKMLKEHKIGANPAAWKLTPRQVISRGSAGNFTSVVPTGQMASDIWKWLIGQGLSEAGAAGVMGNLNQESSLDPSVEESGGTGIGLVQWSFGRADDLRNFAASRGKPWQDLNTQLEFFLSEINGSGEWSAMWNALKTIKDVDEATALFHDTFEKSNDRNVGTYGERPADAHNFYNNFATARGVATGGYISGPGTGTSDSIPARLSNGEYVVRQASVAKYGTGLLDSINDGSLGFRRGITTAGDKDIASIFQKTIDEFNAKRWVTLAAEAVTKAGATANGKAEVKDGLLYGVTAQTIVDHAKQALGTPYSTENRAGGPGKGFDCSSFAYWAYDGYPGLMKNGWGSPEGVGWTGTLKDEGKPRDMSAIKAGDILLHNPDSTGGHAALYIGNGQIQHSANPNQIASVDVWGGFEQARQILAMASGGLVIPALRKGAMINYDNTLANLHRGEAVLTEPLTQKLNKGIDDLASGPSVAYNVSVNIDKANATPYEIEQAVYSALNKKEIRSGRSRVIGGSR